MITKDFSSTIVGFDLGGTLINEEAPKFHALPEDFIQKTGFNPDQITKLLYFTIDRLMKENERQAEDQIPAKTILETALKELKIQAPVAILEEAAWYLLGGKSTTYLQPLPHAVELLQELKDLGATIVALSNTAIPLSILNRIFKTHKIDAYFKTIVLSSECGWRKPSLKAFEQLEKFISFSADDKMIFIGNSYEADISPALKRGYQTVLISDNYNDSDFAQKRTLIVKNLQELYEKVK